MRALGWEPNSLAAFFITTALLLGLWSASSELKQQRRQAEVSHHCCRTLQPHPPSSVLRPYLLKSKLSWSTASSCPTALLLSSICSVVIDENQGLV